LARVPPATLQLQLESELPGEVVVGAGTAVFILGWCFSEPARVRSLAILVDGQPQPVMAHGMPRLGPLQALGQDAAYASGFWGIARIPASAVGRECLLELRAELEGGGTATAELGRIGLVQLPDPVAISWPERASGPRIAIGMATYNPPEELLTRQLESIRGQTHENWVCVISDDCSSEAAYERLLAEVADDPRFVVSRSPSRLGFYRNFERALALAPSDAEFVAMADQDDAWHADKLEVLAGAIGAAQLVYSDARVVGEDGEVRSETWWSVRQNNHNDLLSLLVANSITGAASLLRRDLLDSALPFPPAQFAHFHDHWVGLVALALGDVAYVDRPLYDYVQHGAASLGHAGANRALTLRSRLRNQRSPRERVRMWRLHYFVDVCRLMQFATVLQLRCGERMAPAKRRALARFLNADRSPAVLAQLAWRGVRELAGLSTDTLAAEWMLFCALVWRRLLTASAREGPQGRLRLDALPPPSLILQPGRVGPPPAAVAIADKIAPLRFAVSDRAPVRINILIPTIDLEHFFGGYIAKFNLAAALARRGNHVRVLTVDPVGALPADWRQRLQSYSGLRGLTELIEIEFGRESPGVEVNRGDGFIATTWWTAHIAARALDGLPAERFVYLIQEYEPFTFPMGTYAALAGESYEFPHFALFSSELLRDYFRRHAIGVYADGAELGDRRSLAFENAITPVASPAEAELSARGTRKLLFYARPESHAARNMFELGMLALARSVEEGVLDGWELDGIGTTGRQRRLELGAGASLELLPRFDQGSYAQLLADHDLGLALMYTPHPSLVPIEMASAGMVTVTNTFENKTPTALRAISANLIASPPTVDGIVRGLAEGVARSADWKGRVAGSAVRWSSDWSRSFDRELLARVEAWSRSVGTDDRLEPSDLGERNVHGRA
jgi:glycosyltransferase involved in cell wall biosynthesis